MRQFHHLLLAIILCLLAATSWAGEMAYRVGIYQNPPLAFLDEAGVPSGLFPELLNAAMSGTTLEYVPCDWAGCLRKLESGEIDLLAPIAFTPERGQNFDFLETTILSNWGQIFVPSQANISSILDLNGKRVATLAQDAFLEGPEGLRHLADKFDLQINYLFVKNYDDALHAVAQGGADAALVNRIFGTWHREDIGIKPSSILINPVDIRVAFGRGRAVPLQDELDMIFSEWKDQKGSDYHRLVSKWLTPEDKSGLLPPLWVWPLLIALVTLMLVLWVVVLLTRRQVRLQTRHILKKNQQLKERQQQYRVLFEENHSMMLLIDPETAQVVDANPAACQFYGYSRSDLIGMAISSINTASVQEICAAHVLVDDGQQHKFEFVHRLSNGCYCDVEVFCGPMIVGGRKLLCSVIHDISERLKL